jgi:hypothetical protein
VPLAAFQHLMRHGTEHCVVCDNKGMRTTIAPRLREITLLDPNNEPTKDCLDAEGGMRFMTVTSGIASRPGKSEFLVAAAARIEHLAASSTRERPVFFVCVPSNKQADELHSKFKEVFGGVALGETRGAFATSPRYARGERPRAAPHHLEVRSSALPKAARSRASPR